MAERQQDLDKQKILGEALQRGTLSLADSEQPENAVLAALRMIGGIEERGEGNGVVFKVMKKFTTLLARSRMWTPEQVQEAIDEGKRIERMASGEGE